jgi:hypothetical protein
MPFEKGKDKTGGRTKGISNKSTSRIREAYTNLLEGNLEQLKKDFAELEPEKRIKLFLDMSKYIIPTLKATELDLGDDLKDTLKFTAEEREKRILELIKEHAK